MNTTLADRGFPKSAHASACLLQPDLPAAFTGRDFFWGAQMTIRKHIEPVELRGDIEREIIDVIDAVAMHRSISRVELVEEILKSWAADKVHECTLVMRVAGPKGSSRRCGGSTVDEGGING